MIDLISITFFKLIIIQVLFTNSILKLINFINLTKIVFNNLFIKHYLLHRLHIFINY